MLHTSTPPSEKQKIQIVSSIDPQKLQEIQVTRNQARYSISEDDRNKISNSPTSLQEMKDSIKVVDVLATDNLTKTKLIDIDVTKSATLEAKSDQLSYRELPDIPDSLASIKFKNGQHLTKSLPNQMNLETTKVPAKHQLSTFSTGMSILQEIEATLKSRKIQSKKEELQTKISLQTLDDQSFSNVNDLNLSLANPNSAYIKKSKKNLRDNQSKIINKKAAQSMKKRTSFSEIATVHGENQDHQNEKNQKIKSLFHKKSKKSRMLLAAETMSTEQITQELSQLTHQQKFSHFLTVPLRFIITFVNIILFSLGLVLFIIGIWGCIDQRFDNVNEPIFLITDPTFIALIIGCLLMIFSLQSMFAFWKANILILKFILFILILVASSLGILNILYLILKEKFWDLAEFYLKIQIQAYHFERQSILWLLNSLQSSFECCGASSKFDWKSNSMYFCGNDKSQPCLLPSSCCDFSVQPKIDSAETVSVYMQNGTTPVDLEPTPAPEIFEPFVGLTRRKRQISISPIQPENIPTPKPTQPPPICGYIDWTLPEANTTDYIYPTSCREAISQKWLSWPSLALSFILILWAIILLEIFTISIILKNHVIIKKIEEKLEIAANIKMREQGGHKSLKSKKKSLKSTKTDNIKIGNDTTKCNDIAAKKSRKSKPSKNPKKPKTKVLYSHQLQTTPDTSDDPDQILNRQTSQMPIVSNKFSKNKKKLRLGDSRLGSFIVIA